jgi:hypothetical protein
LDFSVNSSYSWSKLSEKNFLGILKNSYTDPRRFDIIFL